MDPEWVSRAEMRFTALETRAAVDDVLRANVGERLGYIEDALKWLVRLVIGALLMGIITYALSGNLIT